LTNVDQKSIFDQIFDFLTSNFDQEIDFFDQNFYLLKVEFLFDKNRLSFDQRFCPKIVF